MPVSLLVRLLFWAWFAAAVAVGHWQVLLRLPPFGAPAVILGLTAALLLGYFRIRPLRAWVDSLELRALVLLHLTRFVGFYLLILYQRGELPRTFAVPAGIGDIVVATMALPVAFAPLSAAVRPRVLAIWNVFGLVDMLMVIFTAARINLTEPALLRPMLQLPLSLLPTFLVPLILASHVIIFARLLQPQR